MGPAEWDALAAAPPPWIADLPDGTDFSARALFTRSVRRRNFTGFPFWVSCPPETCARVAARARNFAESLHFSKLMALPDYPPETLGFFRERQWLPERPITFPGKRDAKALFLGPDPAEHALVGEVEHWMQIRVRPGLPSEVDAASADLTEAGGEFSHAPGYGFLTSNPAFAGAGLQLECGVHLPVLTEFRRIQSVQQALNALGIEIQPLMLRTSGAAEAGFFRVLSRGGMKFPEDTLYQEFAKRIRILLAAEIEALEKWRNKEKNRLEDRIYRSFHLLQEARTLDFSELLNFLSFTRMGVYLGNFPVSLLPILEELRVQTQPFHLAFLHHSSLASEGDVFRANEARMRLKRAVPKI